MIFPPLLLILIGSPFLAHVFLIEMNIRIDGRLYLSVAQPLLDITGVPDCSDQFGSRAGPKQMGVKWNAAFLALVAKQPFDGFTFKGCPYVEVPHLFLALALRTT